MPKIIENLREDIVSKSIEIIKTDGIEALNIRRLSKELGIAASTVYNYFDSKEAIIGTVAMEKWEETLHGIDEACSSGMAELDILTSIADRLKGFFKPLFAFHISSMKKGREEAEPVSIHRDNYKKEITGQLSAKIEEMLLSRGHGEDEAANAAGVLAALIIACMHNDDLDLRSIAAAMKLFQ